MKISTMTPLIGMTATALFTGIAAAQESPEVEIRRIEIREQDEMKLGESGKPEKRDRLQPPGQLEPVPQR